MNKTLFKYCKNNLNFVGSGRLKKTVSLKRLHEDYGFGSLDDRFCYFNEKDKQQLIERVQLELQVHLFRDSYPETKSRIGNAQNNRNEKVGALKVSDDFVLVNSLDKLCLNQKISINNKLMALGQFICASEVETIEHQQIILVENLAVMANLFLLNIPSELENALWLYRGDTQKHKQTGTANPFFRRFQKTNQLICFSDFDPEGLKIALTSGATHWLTLKQKDDIKIALKGDEFEWFKQQNAKQYLSNHTKLPDVITELCNTMNNNQKTLKQEHMLAHSLPLALYPLI
ncbi:DUF7281 domain-containing protein [Psychromonas hadalis]|uniref:DUF7281 domain-containing protein n=1 Tax=Psychromonas hadalis TaxID=211669 RepID=UPI0003B473BA|nr:hypothetical protein [Psychromonas hadalis]